MDRFRKSLAFRLGFIYSLLFALVFVIVFSVIYLMVRNALLESVKRDLLGDVEELKEAYRKGGLVNLKNFIPDEIEDSGPSNKLIRVLDRGDHVLFSSDSSRWGSLALPDISTLYRSSPVVRTLGIPQRQGHKAQAVDFFAGGYIVEEAVPMKWISRAMSHLRDAFAFGALLTLLIALPIGWFMAKKNCTQIRRIDQVARSITLSTDLSRRVPLKGTDDELDHLAKTFNLMVERLESFLRELRDMMDNTAHDFKTPLARIRTMAETSLGIKNEEEVQGVLVQIMDECDGFLSFLNAVMDISQARTGGLLLEKEEISAKNLVAEIVGLYRGIAQDRRIILTVSFPDDGSFDLVVDRRRLGQALSNILDNALKYTSSGDTVDVQVRGHCSYVEISVSDTGPGIPEEEIPRIFERFYRLDASRSTPGRGIGLSLAKAYVEAHGGTIRVTSELGSGSTFYIILPV